MLASFAIAYVIVYHGAGPEIKCGIASSVVSKTLAPGKRDYSRRERRGIIYMALRVTRQHCLCKNEDGLLILSFQVTDRQLYKHKNKGYIASIRV